jgi:glucose/mannose-6-phosphate isomerase
MYEEIKNFSGQFLFEPKIENSQFFKKKSSFVLAGMGGSALHGGLLKMWQPTLDIVVHKSYGLPDISPGELKNKLIIICSHSGNTEETIDAFQKGLESGLDMVVVSVGGKLIPLAKERNVAYIELPNTGIPPRMATGFFIKAMLKIMGEEEELKKVSALASTLDPTELEEAGKALANKAKNCVPVIYASLHNSPLAYIWKIKLNESGKIPAFCNVFSELNHNEMNSFDVKAPTKALCEKFYFFILKDSHDHPRILKRMEVLEGLYHARALKVETVGLPGENGWLKIFSAIILADWFAYHTALLYGLDPDPIPMVEEFKKLILG